MFEKINYPENRGIHCQLLEIKEYPIHYHSASQLIYVYEGEIELKVAYANYRLRKGDFHYIHPFDTHAIKSITSNNKILFLSMQLEFSCKYYPVFENQLFFVRTDTSTAGKKTYDSLLFLVQNIIDNLNDDDDSKFNNDAIKLLKMLHDNFREFVINKDEGLFNLKISFNQQHSELINRIITYIYQNYQENLNLTKIANEENINSYYLSHLFQHLVGENFRSFLGMVRVEMSEHSLLETTLSISKIAIDVGFSNPKYYVENFKVWFGCHPKEYRKRYANEILGKKKSIVNVLDLKNFNITNQQNHSINLNNSSIYITLNFKAKHSYEAKKNISAVSANNIEIKNLLAQDLFEFDFPKIYLNYTSNQNCMDLINIVTAPNHSSNATTSIYDTAKSLNGMFTINGLKKPLFYFMDFVPQICTAIIERTNHYIISKYNNSFYITLINDNECLEVNFRISFANQKSTCKITNYLLSNKESCFKFWEQLNFTGNISEKEKEEIAAMTRPRISFSILPTGSKQQIQLTLLPKDIAILEINPTISIDKP
jgi:AraC-like DNA-binding protein